jgi:hypothetical protein
MNDCFLMVIWAQAAVPPSGPAPGIPNPTAQALLAFRRWCAGLTLSSPSLVPSLDGLWLFLAGLGLLLALGIVFQGPFGVFKQLLDLPAHLSLVQTATRRVWRAGMAVAAAITFTVLSWTGAQSLDFLSDRLERGAADLALLTRTRSRLETATEQGILSALTPLRDVAGLADNLPLLVCAVVLLFRYSSGMLPPSASSLQFSTSDMGRRSARDAPAPTSRWTTTAWVCGGLYLIYRLIARAAGSPDLPLGGCLILETFLIPALMLVCDGYLLAWLLTEIRNAGFDDPGEDRFHPAPALELMPAAMIACAVALPARYAAHFVFLMSQHLPTTVGATEVGRFIRWLLGWGLIDLQAVSLVFLGLVGIVAWSRGSIRDLPGGFRRLLAGESGHLIAAVAMAGASSFVLAASAYLTVLLLPAAGWVLGAADSYAHYATLPAGLWTLAAMIEITQRTLPVARRCGPEHHSHAASAENSRDEPGSRDGSSLAGEEARLEKS